MKKFLGYILSPFATIAFLLVLCIFHPLQWICYNWFGYAAHKKCVDILNFWLISTYYIVGNSVKFTNNQNLPVGRPMIFIANHQSTFDIPPMIYFLRKYHAKFVSKMELTKGIPSISYNLKKGGGANIDRNDPRQSMKALFDLGDRMKQNNWSAMIFPEGTRSRDGKLKTFQAAGVGAILRKCPDALLVPVAIKNSWKMIQYGLYPLNTFTPMSFEVLEPVEPGTGKIDEVIKIIEDRIKAVVEE
ncbi:lysophospholipid acyltransferase family protein [Mucilaginibacter pedocola]|uniref:Glycerol acyltransferase n=1 Tax=Mucilaginibacter pedocola TaxID=1792845 RepID=A0A1S9P9N0_9SPHI|nr:lysophospholipid acyltransferase family protein [Mucilaginibacter pedocola]OOQ57661.1 glycerol acyltransferase [Mucilaginibacter pedocola]